MDRRSWLWRRKSSEKSPGETESSVGSISSHSERFSDDQVYLNQHSQSPEVTSKAGAHEIEHNHEEKTLSEKLSDALVSIKAKEESVKQHIKVAEEAVSGWEKSEREVLALRQQVEVLTIKNSTLEDRVLHLDGALKECLRQLRQAREEKDHIVQQALEKKNSETESSLTSADTEVYHKLEMAEKENSNLKLQLSSMAEELEIRLIEKDLSNQTAEQACKQYLDSVKKVVMLEAECHMLKATPQKAFNHESKGRKMTSIIQNDELKETSEFGRNQMDSFADMDLMDDFLEMERLAAMQEISETEERSRKVESLDIVLKDRENELKTSRSRLEEVENKLYERENELIASKDCLEEVKSKLDMLKNELNASRNRLEDTESKLAACENKLNSSRNQFEEAELKLNIQAKELKASRYQLEEAKSKLAEHVNKLNASNCQVEEAESKLAEQEIKLKASVNQLKEAETKLHDRETELDATSYLLEEAESKLDKTLNHLEMAESRCKALEAELEILVPKVKSLETDVQKERDLSRKAEAKCRELENEVIKLQHEVKGPKSGITQAEELRFIKIKQEAELAKAGSKFAECQKTIASLSRQLKTLATLDDFLIDTDS
uniref:filament-like plant protein 3 n=1 Tax=Erigeron canadensis TaxID=72917 RepID=UPI001CB8C011|nr:filament-like plant protein 3 [Erigeron canadensis]